MPALSRAGVQKHIKNQHVRVNDVVVAPHHWLKHGDRILVADEPTAAKARSTVLPKVKVVFENDDFVIVVKPIGLLTHETDAHEPVTLAAWALKNYPEIKGIGEQTDRPGIVHRIDRDVSGLMVIARNKKWYAFLKQAFQDRVITKEYYALVYGIVPSDEGKIDRRLMRNKKSGKMVAQTGTDGGRDAETQFSVVERFKNYTLLTVKIITGRTHQIRAHLFAVGHSIVGDPLYQTRDIRKQKNHALDLATPFLFAYHLGFTGPDGTPHDFKLPLPVNFKKIISSLAKQ